ncbi:MAG: TonB family protein [Chthoniobacteraceae bacterium]|nr:TonB family protein [Chthoniobacteraceae bacterium]
MRASVVLSFLAALLFHAFLLFGLRLGTLARPLPMGDGPSVLEVGLAGAPGGAEAAGAEAPASPEPEPTQTPPPPPAEPAPSFTPEPTPAPELIAPTSPEPLPAPAPASTPKAAPSPNPQANPPAHPTRRTGAGTPKAHAGGSASGSTGNGTGGGGGGTSALPRYRTNPKPVYPPEARRNHQEGVVLLSVEIGADGQPKSVAIKRTSGFPLLDQSAVQAVRRWTFEPATTAGLPVATRADIPVRFSLAGGSAR